MPEQIVTSTSAPWEQQQPYLLQGFQEAQNLLGQGGPSYFPDSTVAPMGNITRQALNQVRRTAQAGTPVPGAATDQLTQTLQGDYLNSNPYLDAMYNQAANRVTEHYQEAVAPQIAGNFGLSGRTGSNMAFANAMQNSRQDLGDSLAQMAGNIYGQNYQQERGRQMQAAGMAPSIAPLSYYDQSQLLNVGETYDQQAQREIGDQFNRYMFEQERPYDNLGRYMGYLGGNYGQTQTQPFDSTARNLGLVGTGLGLFQEYGDNIADFLGGLNF